MQPNSLTLPPLTDTITVDEATIKGFRKNGHALVRGILSPDEVAVYREVIRIAAKQFNTEKRKLEERDTYGKAFLQIMNLWEVDAAVKKFTICKRVRKIAAALLGVKHLPVHPSQS